MRYLLCIFSLCCCPHLGALEINQATEAELDSLRGLGPAFTRRVLAARSQQPFKDWPDLMRRVSGMGPRVVRKLSDQGLTVQGQVLSPGLL